MRRRQGQLHPWGFLLRQRDGGLAAPPVALVHDHVALGRGTAPPPGAAHAVAGMQQCPLQFITIDDERVSRLHAALTVHCNSSRWPPLVTVEDRSRNGTYLNGSPLRPGAPAVLSSGDVLSLVLCVNPLTQLCFVFEECPVPPPNWTRAANAQEGAGSSAQSGNTAVRRPTATGGDALGAGGAAGAAAGAAPYPVLPVGLPRASGNLNAALSAAAVAAALAAGRGTSRNSRGHRAGRSNRSPAAAATSTAGTETLGLVDPLAAAAPHRLSGTGFSEGGVEQWPSGAGPREVTSPQPSLPPASLPQSPDRRRITRQSTGSGVPRSLSPDSSPTSVVGESAHGFPLEGGGGRRHSVPVGGASWDRHDDHWPEPHSPTATPRSRVHNHTVAQVLAALHPNPLYADHLTALELAPGTAPPASPPRSPRSTPLRAPVTGAAARASRPSRRSTGSGMAAADGHHQRHQRHRRSRTAHLGAHLLAFAAAGVAAPADSAVSAARGGISLSRSLPQLLPVDLVGNHQFHELRLQQHSSAQAGGYMSAAAVPSLSSVSDSTPAYAGWPVHGLAGSGGSAPATSAATSTSSSSRHSLHSPLSQPSLHSRYLLTGGAEAVLNSPRRQRFSTGSGFGPPLPVLPPPPLSSAPSASSAFADPTQAEALAQAHRRPRALSYGSGSFGLEEENSGGGSGGSGTHTALVPRISAPTLDAFGSVSDAPMLTPAPPSAPLPACGSGSGSPRSAPAAAAVIVGGGPRSSRSSASRPQSRLLRVSRPNSPLPGYENSGGVGSTGFAAAWAAGGAGAASCRGGDVGTAGAGAVDELAYGMDMQGHEGGNNCELLAPLPSSPRFGPGGRGGAGSLPDAASEFGQGASGAGSGVAGAGVGGTATAVPLRRLCSAAVAALAAAAEATASESDTPSEITCKEFSFSSLSRPTLSAPAAASSPPGANRDPCCSPSVPAIALEPAASVPTAAAASVNLEARLHTAAADGGSGGSPRFLRRTVSANDGPQAQTLHRQQQLQLQQQQHFGNASDAFLVAVAAAGAPPTLRVSASSVRAAAPGPQRSVSAGSHGCSSRSVASSADCAAASEVSGAYPEGPWLQRGGVEAALQHSPQAAMVAVAAAAAQLYGGGAATGGAASSLPTASRQLQCRCSGTGGGGESSGSGTGLSDASMPSPRWAGAHGAGEDGGSSSTPSSGRPQRLAAGRHPNRRLTRYGECLDTPSPRSPAVTSSSHAGAGASPFRHADSYRLAALAALAAASPAAASPVPVPAAAAVAAAATQAAPSWPSPARATRPRGAASPACRRLRLEGAEPPDAAAPSPCSGARSGRSWPQHDLSGGGAVAEPARPLAPSAVTLPVSVARSGSEGSALRSAAPPPAWPHAQAAVACPSLPYTPSSLVRYLDSRLGSLAAAAEAAVAEAGEEIGAQLASLEAAAAVAAAGGAAGGGARSQSRSAAAPGLNLELGLDLDLPALPPVPMPTAIGFGGDGTLGNRRFNAAAPSFRGYQSPEGMLMRAGGGADEALTPRSGHGSVCGSTGGAAAASFDEARGSGAGGDCGRSPVGSSGSCARSCVGNAAAGGAAARLALGRALSTSATVGSPRAGRRAPLAAATDSGCDLDHSPPHKPINSTCATPRKQSPPHKPITSTCATPRKHTPRASFSQSHSQVFHEDQGCDHHHHHGHHRQLSRGGGVCLLLHDQAQGHSRTAAAAAASGTAARSGSSSQGLPLQPSPSGRPPTAESDTLPLHDAGSGSCGNSSGGGWSAQASSREGYAYAYGSAGWPGEQCYPPAAHYHYQQHQDRQVLQLHSRRVSGGAASTLEAPPPSEVDVARAMSTGRGCDNAGDGDVSVGMGHAGWGPQAQAAAQQQQRRVSGVSRGSSSSCRPSTSGSGCSSEFWAAAVVPVDQSPAAAAGAHGVVQLAVAPAQQRQQQPGPPVASALSRSGLSLLKVDVRQEDGVPGAEGPATGRLAGSPGSSQLVCGLCAGGLRAAVALTPCGHSFCAECLAGHLGSAMLGGSRVGCPNRCPAFEAVVINHPARRLESKRSNAATATAAPGSRAPARAQPDGQCESSPFEAPAAAAAVAAHAAARASVASTPVRGARGGSDPGPAASPALRAAGGAASMLRTRMGSRGSGYGPSPSRRREEEGTGSEPGAWSEMLADAALPVPAIRLHLQQGEVLLRALSELLDDTPQLPPPQPPSIPAATATTTTSTTTSTAAAAAAAATQAATAAVREARAAVVEWRRVVLDVLGCLGRLALEHVRVREALGAAGASQGCVLALRAVQAQMAAAELCTKGGERSLVDKDGIVKKPTVAEAEEAAEAALVAEERATAQDTSRAACVLLCHLLNPPTPSTPSETGATESEQAVCRQQSNQWALARMGGAEALLALLLPAQEPGKGATDAGGEGAAGDGSAERRRWSGQTAAALTALQKMVVGNIMTQTHVAECGSAAVIRTLAAATRAAAASGDEAVQAAALRLLADVARGGDAAHAAVRQMLLEAGALGAALAALRDTVAACGGCSGGREGAESSGRADGGSAASSGMEVSPVVMAALDAVNVLLGPSEQHVDGSEPPPALQAVVRRELRRLGAPRLLAECVRELRLQQEDEQGEGRAQEEWERGSASCGRTGHSGHAPNGRVLPGAVAGAGGKQPHPRPWDGSRSREERGSAGGDGLGCGPVLRAMAELQARVCVVAGGAGWVGCVVQMLGVSPDGVGQAGRDSVDGGGAAMAAVAAHRVQLRLLAVAAGGGFALGAAVMGAVAAMWMA